MESFGEFLVGMGYPEARIRNPFDGAWSHSPYEDADRLAGIAAWYYEKDGMTPMLIGHSQGGMQAVKVLHVLAGDYGTRGRRCGIRSPTSPSRAPTIVDPLTGRQAVRWWACGWPTSPRSARAAPRFILPNQWSLIGKLRTIPDNVEEFTGYWIDVDLWAWTLPGTEQVRDFVGSGKARMRNVTLLGSQQPRVAARVGRPCRRAREHARGSTPTCPGPRSRPPPMQPGQHRSGPPTCGTTSRSSGRWRRSA